MAMGISEVRLLPDGEVHAWFASLCANESAAPSGRGGKVQSPHVRYGGGGGQPSRAKPRARAADGPHVMRE